MTLSEQSPEALIGAQIDDYVIERVIGRGGMSVVYFARDVRAGKPAAIKVLQEGLPESMSADRRLEQEARAIARIDHPHVVRVFRFGWTPNALPYLSMEYLEGEPLSQHIGRGRPMNTKRLLSIVDEMLGALSAAHALDIIHRDVKPDNVFLVRKDGREDFVKMVDFGIAKLRGNHPSRLVDTVRGVVLGTPEYLPPEIAMDEAVFPSTDLYAVGVILFEGLTGRLPFIGRGAGELAEQHCFTPAPRLRPFNRLIAAELEQIVLRCLNKDPKRRPQTAEELSGLIRPFIGAADTTQTQLSVSLLYDDGAVQHPADLDLIERVIRDEIGRRWQGEQPPEPLLRGMRALDDLREGLTELETDLALVDDRLLELGSELDAERRALDRVTSEERRLTESIKDKQEGVRAVSESLAGIDDAAAAAMGALTRGGESASTLVQDLLGDAYLDKVVKMLEREEEVRALDARREALLEEIGALVEQRVQKLGERAHLEARLSEREASVSAERLQTTHRREVLRGRLDARRRTGAVLLAGTALDLAVALGQR